MLQKPLINANERQSLDLTEKVGLLRLVGKG